MTDKQKLAALAALCQSLAGEQAAASEKMASLRAAGKEKSVQFKEQMGKKLSNSIVISRLQAAGLWECGETSS